MSVGNTQDSPKKVVPVILSGGMGTRLWPMSRESYPKQFLKLADPERSLIQQTALRVGNNSLFEPPVVVCNVNHRFMVAEQLQRCGITNATVLLEPCGRNTAPALAAAACYIQEQYENALMLVLPSDHIIRNEQAFLTATRQAAGAAQDGYLTTFGITPEYPETGYGYIQQGEAITDHENAYRVAAFKEKPDSETAAQYVNSGNYAWNSGMFMFPVEAFLNEMKAHQPRIREMSQEAVNNKVVDHDFVRLNEASFSLCPAISVDYAVMEKTQQAAVVPADCGWSDAGSWDSLWRIADKDEHENVITGTAYTVDTQNCYLRSEDGPTIATLGVDNLTVISTKDTVLVADNRRAQDIKKLVEEIKQKDSNLVTNHRRVYRPWGYYDSINEGKRHQVKRINVKPGATLSLQMHYHRAEHWVIVRGTARVFRDGEEKLLTENQSIYIPVGATHRIENPGKIDLDIIEVQSGSYLGEDDIVRFEDRYGRTEKKAEA